MPYTSQAQAGYFHTHKAQLEKEGVDVDEWDRKTKGKKLPRRARDVNGMVPGDCPGSMSTLSALLDRLIHFDIRMRVVKKALKEMLGASRVPIIRGDIGPGFIPHPQTRLAAQVLKSTGIKSNAVHIPRISKGDLKYFPKQTKEILARPALSALHEAGHSVDPNISKVATASALQLHPAEHAKLLGGEVVANKNASEALRRGGATPPELSEWRNRAHAQMRTGYRWPFVQVRAGGIPGGPKPTISESKQVLRDAPWLRKKNLGFMSHLLDSLIEFDDAALFKRMRELGMGHQIRGLTGGAAEHVSAPSTQARASKLLTIPPQPAMKNEERISLLNRLHGIRRRNEVRQSALREAQRQARRPGGYFPERSEVSRLLSAKLDNLIQLGNDPRPRNSLGEYAQQQEGVADPNSMAKTYNNPNSNAGIARTAIIGGAAGTVGAGATKGIGQAMKALYSKLHVKK